MNLVRGHRNHIRPVGDWHPAKGLHRIAQQQTALYMALLGKLGDRLDRSDFIIHEHGRKQALPRTIKPRASVGPDRHNRAAQIGQAIQHRCMFGGKRRNRQAAAFDGEVERFGRAAGENQLAPFGQQSRYLLPRHFHGGGRLTSTGMGAVWIPETVFQPGLHRSKGFRSQWRCCLIIEVDHAAFVRAAMPRHTSIKRSICAALVSRPKLTRMT